MRRELENPVVIQREGPGIAELKSPHAYFAKQQSDNDTCNNEDQSEQSSAPPDGARARSRSSYPVISNCVCDEAHANANLRGCVKTRDDVLEGFELANPVN
jgi:hypothetical protein